MQVFRVHAVLFRFVFFWYRLEFPSAKTLVAVFFLAAQNNSEKYHMKNTQKLRFEKKTSEARNKNTPQNISHCSQPHLFFALYNGVKPRCEAPGKRNDTTISKSLKPSLFVANVEDPRSELLSSNKRERRLGDALSRSQANQQTHWEKEKRGRTYSKVDLRSLSFNSNIKKYGGSPTRSAIKLVFLLPNCQCRAHSNGNRSNGADWQSWRGWHVAFLCVCWVRPLGVVFSFHPSQPGTGLVSFLWVIPQKPS